MKYVRSLARQFRDDSMRISAEVHSWYILSISGYVAAILLVLQL
jgi:hypothetical protein